MRTWLSVDEYIWKSFILKNGHTYFNKKNHTCILAHLKKREEILLWNGLARLTRDGLALLLPHVLALKISFQQMLLQIMKKEQN